MGSKWPLWGWSLSGLECQHVSGRIRGAGSPIHALGWLSAAVLSSQGGEGPRGQGWSSVGITPEGVKGEMGQNTRRR